MAWFKTSFVRAVDGEWLPVPARFKRIQVSRSHLGLGINSRNHWYLSASSRWRGPKFAYEWHNYPGNNTLFAHVDVGLRPDRYSRFNVDVGVWVPETSVLWPLLRRFPAKVYRRH